ncbi:MAG TPA: TrmH family RNA methyltransferase [Candidatus Pullichristensenella avicola]|nr:TrmH family RNA methyltransferase [Candidatus Pullichristensenella avicola]
MPKLEPYARALPYSYALGLFPSLTLIDARPELAMRLLVHPDGMGGEGVEKLRARCRDLGVREEEAARVLRRESKKDNCYAGIVFEKREGELNGNRNHAVLCQISDGGNLGTALRSLLGFGYEDVALVRPCVDAFDPHVVRASMGAFFRLRLRTFDTFEDYRALYPERPLYPFMLDGALPLDEVAAAARTPFSLVFGNEQSGLPAVFQTYGQSVFIPQSDKIDSLNLSVAVSIGAYAFRQKEETL